MRLQFSHVRLLVSDYDRAFAFYRDVVGLPVRFSDEASGYGEFETGTVTIALYLRQNMVATTGLTASTSTAGSLDRPLLVFRVADVDAAAAALQGKGVTLALPPTNRPQWTIRTAHFHDPDGNLIEINGPLKSGA